MIKASKVLTQKYFSRIFENFLSVYQQRIFAPFFLPITNISKSMYVFRFFHFLLGLQHDVSKFFIYSLTLILTSLAASSLCILVSSSVSLLAVANLLVSLPFVFMMVWIFLLLSILILVRLPRLKNDFLFLSFLVI